MTLKKSSKTIKSIKVSYIKASTSKKSIATVKILKKSGKATGFKVSAKKAGTATITIKVTKGTYKGSYKCKVTVKAKKKKPASTKKPTPKPTVAPTEVPTTEPTVAPTEVPTTEPTVAPTEVPTTEPTVAPTEVPTTEPTVAPTEVPTTEPTVAPTKAPTAEPTVVPTEVPTVVPTEVPTTTPVSSAKLKINVTDKDGKAVNGATITVLQGDDVVVKETTLDKETSSFETEELKNGEYTVKVSKDGYDTTTATAVINGEETEAVTVALKDDVTAPFVKEAAIADKGNSIVLTMSEKVKAENASATITGNSGVVELAAPTVSEDGMTVTITSVAANAKLPDDKYVISALNGITDIVGNNVTGETTIEKKTTYENISITSIGFAPAAGQSISYNVIDNYGAEYTDVSKMLDSNLPGLYALKLTVTNKGKDGNLSIPVAVDNSNKFDLSSLEKGTKIEIKAEIVKSGISLISNTKTLEIGDAAVATSFKEIGLFMDDNDYGTSLNPIYYLKDGGKTVNVKVILIDQYGNEMPNAKGQTFTLTTSDKGVLGLDSSGDKDNVKLVKIENDTTCLYSNIKVNNIGTATISAYLENGQSISKTFTVNAPKLESIGPDASSAPNTDVAVKEEKTIDSSVFTFTYDEDLSGTYKTPASDLSISFESATNNATANDISATIEANEDGSFKDIKIKALKAAEYNMVLTSKNNNQSVKFKVSATQDTEVADLKLNTNAISIKNGGVSKTIGLQFVNKYGDTVDVTAENIEGKIDTVLYDAEGSGVNNITNILGIKYLKADGTEASGSDVVTALSLTYKGDVADYTLHVSLDGKPAKSSDVKISGSVATVNKVEISNGITSSDKVIANDSTTSKFIKLNVTDQNGEVMAAQGDSAYEVVVTKATDLSVVKNGLITVVKAKIEDGKLVEDNDNGTIDALKVDPSVITSNDGAISYNVTVKDKDTGKISASKSIKICEIRKLNNVTVDAASKTLVYGNTTTVNITSYDQYGDKMDIKPEADTNNEIVAAEVKNSINSETDAYTVTINTTATGNVTKEFTITNGSSANGTNADIVKKVNVNVNVIDSKDLKSVSVKNTDLKLRQIDFEKNWKEINLDLVGKDASGNDVVMNADDVTFDLTSVPEYIGFNQETGELSINKDKIDNTVPATANIPVKIISGKNILGNFAIDFVKADPTPVKVEESFNPSEADDILKAPLSIVNNNTPVDIANKKFKVTTSYGDIVEITAKDLEELKSNDSKVTVEESGDTVNITVAATAAKGNVATITGKYTANGETKTVTFDVTVK